MKSFKNNLVWILFMVFIIGALVMLLTTGPDPFAPAPPQYSAIVEPTDSSTGPAATAADQPKPATGLADANRSNQLRRLARLLSKQGDLDRALALHRQSLALETKLDNPAGIAIQHDNIAAVLLIKGDAAKACAAWTLALAALGPAPAASGFSLKGQGTGERLRVRIRKSRQENACLQ
jgi:hypothetical protein